MPDRAAELLEALIREARAAARSPSADAVHDLRVAIRRFTAALAMRKMPRAERKEIRSGLKQVMQSAGNVRDYDIAL